MSSYLGDIITTPRYLGDVEMDYLFVGNSNLVSLVNLRGAGFGETYVNAATVSMVLLDATGTTVSGPTFPISLSYVTSSPGVYEGVLPSGTELTPGDEYDLILTATASELDSIWRIPFIARYQR